MEATNETKVQEQKHQEVVPVQAVSDIDVAEKAVGVSEVAANTEGMAQVMDEEVKDGDKPDVMPSFFVESSDRQRIELNILYYAKTGKLYSISRAADIDMTGFMFLKLANEWFEFSVPGYDDMAIYRQRSAVYRKEVDKMVVDKVQLRNFFLVWHLKDWSLRDRKGNKVTLAFSSDGSLTEESIRKVYKVGTPILDVVLTLFEKDVLFQ